MARAPAEGSPLENDFYTILVQSAKDAGFPLANAFDLDSAPLKPHLDRFDRWIENGFAGSMDYLKRGRDRRGNPSLLFPNAQSILCVALPYLGKSIGSRSTGEGPRYARYLAGEDYHRDIAKRLEDAMRDVESKWKSPAGTALQWKICVDTSAVLERSWAAFAGLGWIGKNTLLIHPRHGSYLFLGEVFINQKTHRGPTPLPNYCGNCNRCLNSCPTQAFESVGWLDARKCISYWTLEKRGNLEIGEADKQKMRTWVAGCDVCQEVCPFNSRATKNALLDKPSAVEPSATDLWSWESLFRETQEEYRRRTRDSSLKRVKPSQFKRNLAIAFTNALIEEQTPPAPWIETAILDCLQTEADGAARAELRRCLQVIRKFTKP